LLVEPRRMKKLVIIVMFVVVLGAEAYLFQTPIIQYAKPVIRVFSNIVYYDDVRNWHTSWLGVEMEKYPTDLYVYQEIIYETKPDVLIEAGTYRGGSAYYYASLFDLLRRGRVITMDIEDQPDKPKHPRIEYLLLSSVSDEAVRHIRAEIKPEERVMVSLDSNHTAEHVFKELQIYAPMVSKGCYLVVEDTDINGHPVNPHFGPGPMEALNRFLAVNHDFEPDRSRERVLLTVSPRGYLRRVH
jgi:cephalosporin hydroxylase